MQYTPDTYPHFAADHPTEADDARPDTPFRQFARPTPVEPVDFGAQDTTTHHYDQASELAMLDLPEGQYAAPPENRYGNREGAPTDSWGRHAQVPGETSSAQDAPRAGASGGTPPAPPNLPPVPGAPGGEFGEPEPERPEDALLIQDRFDQAPDGSLVYRPGRSTWYSEDLPTEVAGVAADIPPEAPAPDLSVYQEAAPEGNGGQEHILTAADHMRNAANADREYAAMSGHDVSTRQAYAKYLRNAGMSEDTIGMAVASATWSPPAEVPQPGTPRTAEDFARDLRQSGMSDTGIIKAVTYAYGGGWRDDQLPQISPETLDVRQEVGRVVAGVEEAITAARLAAVRQEVRAIVAGVNETIAAVGEVPPEMLFNPERAMEHIPAEQPSAPLEPLTEGPERPAVDAEGYGFWQGRLLDYREGYGAALAKGDTEGMRDFGERARVAESLALRCRDFTPLPTEPTAEERTTIADNQSYDFWSDRAVRAYQRVIDASVDPAASGELLDNLHAAYQAAIGRMQRAMTTEPQEAVAPQDNTVYDGLEEAIRRIRNTE